MGVHVSAVPTQVINVHGTCGSVLVQEGERQQARWEVGDDMRVVLILQRSPERPSSSQSTPTSRFR